MLSDKRARSLFAGVFFAALAIIFAAIRVPAVLCDPFFPGDSGLRMANAGRMLITVGNRTWLPFLQAHIFLLYKLTTPYYLFKFIPLFYFFLALIFLGKLARRHLGLDRFSLIFSGLLLFAFAFQRCVLFLSTNLYHEIVAIAFFYILLYLGALELKKNWIALAIASLALLTRDVFSIYLVVVTLLNFKQIFSDRAYVLSFAWLWSIVILSRFLSPLSHLSAGLGWPSFPYEWPLGINQTTVPHDLLVGARSLFASFSSNNVYGLILVMFLIWAAMKYFEKKTGVKTPAQEEFFEKFSRFSAISLLTIYFLVVAFDPWQCTFGNARMGFPLIEHLFIWAIIFYSQASRFPEWQRSFRGPSYPWVCCPFLWVQYSLLFPRRAQKKLKAGPG
jgi:hypothetical protein